MKKSRSGTPTVRSIKSHKSLVGFLVVIIIVLQKGDECEGVKSFIPLRFPRAWEISIQCSLFAGGWLARTISAKSILGDPVTIPSPSKSPGDSSPVHYPNNGTVSRATSSNWANAKSNQFLDDVHLPPGHEGSRYRRLGRNSEKGRLRLELLKQIKSLDHMKCFPKVLCGLSVDSSKSASGIDPGVVKSYIQLMTLRSSKPEDDSSGESRPTRDHTKDALSQFLMKAGIIKPKKTSGENSGSTSASDEEEYDDDPEGEFQEDSPDEESVDYKSAFERNREQLENILLSKRVLDTGDNDGNSTHNQIHHNLKDDPSHYSPVLYMNPSSVQKGTGDSSTSSSKIGSLVSSWVPWLSFSLGSDSFEKDPFFTPGSKKNDKDASKHSETWQKDFDRLAYVMKLKQAVDRQRKKNSLKKKGRGLLSSHEKIRTRKVKEDEMLVYATAVEIGQKLKDPRQCDYLYNGCPIPYSDIIKIISSIRKEIKQEEEIIESLSQEMFGTELPIPASAVPVQKRKQQSTTKPKPKVKPTRKQQVSRPPPVKVQAPVQAPMTKISHTLPNGEKVEINVQVSGKHDLPPMDSNEEEYQDDPPQREEDYPEEERLDDSFNLGEDEKVPEIPEEEEEPAISASYELDDELHEDFRKPTPLEIFNKISLISTEEPPSTTSTTTTVAPTTTRYTVTKKSKPKPPSTTTTKATTTTTKKPTTTKPSTRPPTTSKRPANTRRPTTKRTKPPTVKPRVRPTYSTRPPVRKNKRPISTTTEQTTRRPTRTTTVTVRTKRPTTSRRPTTTTTRPSRRTTTLPVTTKAPARRKKPTTTETAEPLTSTAKVTMKPSTSTTLSPVDEELEEEEIIPSKKMVTSTASPIPFTPTEPALAIFTTTTNFLLDYIVKDLSTTERLTRPSLYSTLAPVITRYSVKKSKPSPASVNTSVTSIEVETVPETPFFSSMQYDSSEISVVIPQKAAETILITREEPQTPMTVKTTTTMEPKLFGNKGSNKRPGVNKNRPTSPGGKRIIKYKNAKLPHLVLMTVPTLDSISSPEGLSESVVTITGNRRRPKPIQKPHYSLAGKKPNNKTSVENPPPPLVFLPGLGSGENAPWIPQE